MSAPSEAIDIERRPGRLLLPLVVRRIARRALGKNAYMLKAALERGVRP